MFHGQIRYVARRASLSGYPHGGYFAGENGAVGDGRRRVCAFSISALRTKGFVSPVQLTLSLSLSLSLSCGVRTTKSNWQISKNDPSHPLPLSRISFTKQPKIVNVPATSNASPIQLKEPSAISNHACSPNNDNDLPRLTFFLQLFQT